MEKVEKAYAKLNLTLDIVGESRGFHLLDMLVCTLDLYDEVTVSRRSDGRIRCLMDGVLQGENNSAVRAAKLLNDSFKTGGFDISIKKNIPLAGGLGGSTADGVAVIRAIVETMDINKNFITPQWLLQLGSDAPCMYENGVKRVRGIGEKVGFIDINLPYKVAFIAGSGVDTAAAYKLFDTLKLQGGDSTARLINEIGRSDFDVADYLSNDLFIPACKLNPGVLSASESLRRIGAKAVNMSGSGSTVYGLYKFSDTVTDTKEVNISNFIS